MYNVLINADQAAAIVKDVNSIETCEDEGLIIIRKHAEIDRIASKIIEAAENGWSSIEEWIEFTDTFEELVVRGYVLTKGRVKEKLPESVQKLWGTVRDRFIISWGDV